MAFLLGDSARVAVTGEFDDSFATCSSLGHAAFLNLRKASLLVGPLDLFALETAFDF